jgi:hypothetical protein
MGELDEKIDNMYSYLYRYLSLQRLLFMCDFQMLKQNAKED